MLRGEYQYLQPWMKKGTGDAAQFQAPHDPKGRPMLALNWEDPHNKLKYLQCLYCAESRLLPEDSEDKKRLYMTPDAMKLHLNTCQCREEWLLADDRRLKSKALDEIWAEARKEQAALKKARGEVGAGRVFFRGQGGYVLGRPAAGPRRPQVLVGRAWRF